ncbi:hypothetical protein DB30_04459 [Enhygromyxa salina]|uniref:Uncharacterized protein n=1 Tax=Enhygromyxa salina TaxID=215803 RepID=A0A0C2D3W6_9BACT|nr:hypothetical protein [Enhygromyxa salina]KIG16415.1 hypothetical protein DB30_04459 [Enhygromyxa salina]
MNNQSIVTEFDEQLSAYFDGELGDGSLDAGDAESLGATLRALVNAETPGDLDSDEELAAKLADLAFMRTMIVGALEHQAERVPEARFEQVWDGFEQALERESRLQEAAEAPPSVWQRLSEWIRPVRLPLAVVGAAGALVLVFARSAGAPNDVGAHDPAVAANSQPSNTQDEPASDAEPTAQARTNPAPAPAPEPVPRVAVAPEPPSPEIAPEMYPQPEPGEAEIRRIEFGGRTGTISQVEGTRGTTTVIWVTEDDGPVDSERSL